MPRKDRPRKLTIEETPAERLALRSIASQRLSGADLLRGRLSPRRQEFRSVANVLDKLIKKHWPAKRVSSDLMVLLADLAIHLYAAGEAGTLTAAGDAARDFASQALSQMQTAGSYTVRIPTSRAIAKVAGQRMSDDDAHRAELLWPDAGGPFKRAIRTELRKLCAKGRDTGIR